MFKKIVFMLTFVVLSSFSVVAFADTNAGLLSKVRVGLEYKYVEVSTVPIANTDIVVGYEQNGNVFPEFELTAQAGLSFKVSNSFVILIEKYYNTYDEAKTAANTYTSGNTYPASIKPGQWAVYAGGFSTQTEANNYLSKFTNATVLGISSKRIELRNSKGIVAYFECAFANPQIYNSKSFVNLGDRQYRGCIEFGRYAGKNISAVNVLSMDEYLYGVVPSEMPYSWPKEALKAQAVAARTFSLTQVKHNGQGYDLCDAVHCQVYIGVSQEKDATNVAVNETSGVVAYYNGTPINATFFASSGGITENSEDVWSAPLPYLRSVQVLEINPKIWTRTFSLSDLDGLLKANGYSIGKATGMKVSATDAAGRVAELTITGTAGTAKLTKEFVRTFFAPNGGMLDSKNFKIVASDGTIDNYISVRSGEQIILTAIKDLNLLSANQKSINGNISMIILNLNGSSTVFPTQAANANVKGGFVLVGSGNGHGVGMSQEGARSMALEGATYIDILKKFYTGVVVE